MKIRELAFGLERDGAPVALAVHPAQTGLTIIPTPLGLDPKAAALAVRETICSASRSTRASVPFVRVQATVRGDESLEISVADDAYNGVRMLTEGREGAIPLVMEAEDGPSFEADAELEVILGRIAIATGAERAEQLGLSMGLLEASDAETEAPGDEDARAFLDASQRAAGLAAQVRSIDDKMTASVVPDWIWIATGFGGLGIVMTVIVLLYPELRIYLIPAILGLSILGFVMYGLRSLKELRVRGRLQVERAELRARREDARAAAQSRAEALRSKGQVPEALLAQRTEGAPDANALRRVPAVLGHALDEEALERAQKAERQILLFIDADARQSQPWSALQTHQKEMEILQS